MKNLMDFCIGTVVFIFLGFGLLLGEDALGGFIGLPTLGIFTDYANFDWSNFVFNLVFCATAATIVSGAMAERTKFLSYCIYSGVISAVVYPIEAHWIWGGGWLAQMGFHDFAGSAAIHTVGGLTAFIGAAMVGPRIGKFSKDKNGTVTKVHAFPGHNLVIGALGCFILWFGWYGFNGAAAEVAVLAHIAVADVGQVAHGVAAGKVGVFGLHIGTQMHAVVGDGVHPHMGEGADVVVGADVAAVDLAGVDGSALVHGAVLDEGVGADDAACADDRLAPQNGARKDHSARGNDHLRVDLHGAAVDDNAVCNVLHKDVLAGSFGGVQLCQSSGAGLFRNRIRHEKISLPTKARGGRETEKATGKLLPVRPASPLRKALFRQNKNEKVTGIESCIQQDEKSRVQTKNLSNFLPFYTTLKLSKFQGICIKNNRQIRDFAWWKGMDFLV